MRLCWAWARTASTLIAAGRQAEGPEPLRAPASSHEPFGYESRSLRLPFFSLSLPLLWSERPSLLSFLSPVSAPPASFIRPLALSIFPSSLSSLPPLPPSRPIRPFAFAPVRAAPLPPLPRLALRPPGLLPLTSLSLGLCLSLLCLR